MTTGKALQSLLLVALAAFPGADARAGLTLRAGALYTQLDAWSLGGARSTAPHLDVELGLDARGVIVSRDVVAYRLNGQYRTVSDSVDGVETGSSSAFLYSAAADLLNNAVSPVSLSLHGARQEVTFASDPSQDVHGTGLSTSAGATMNLMLDGKPGLTATYGFFRTEQTIPGQPDYESTIHSLGSSLGFGTTAFQVQASYSGQFHEGAWTSDNFASHDVDVSAYVPVGGTTLAIESLSSFTIPDQLVEGAYEQQTSAFRTSFSNNGTTGNRRAFSYSYGHTLTETPSAPAAELTHQGVSYQGDHLLTDPNLFTRWLVDASLAQARSGTTEARSTGETLGVDLWWRRLRGATTYEASAGPRVGLFQTEADESTGFGASARLRLLRPLWSQAFHVEWSGTYSRQLFAVAGWQLSQTLSSSLSGRSGSARFDTTLRASAFRTASPITGAGAGRSLEALARMSTRRLGLDARVGFQSGIVGATPGQFVGDGLLLPAPFNSHSLDASAGASLKIFSGLSGQLRGRFGASEGPGRPTLRQAEAIAGLSYAYGAFGLAVEDRLTRTEVVGGWNTVSLLMVRAYRTLAW